MRYVGPGGQERAAYTDKLGYAGAALTAPDRPGKYSISVSHLDSRGEEPLVETPLYVWEDHAPVVAVDLDCLPQAPLGNTAEAAPALHRLRQEANVVYLTRGAMGEPKAVRQALQRSGYPDGPVLLWRMQRWHIIREGSLPRVVVESRLVSRLPDLRQSFPNLNHGLCNTALAAKAFAEAGIQPVVVGPAMGDLGDARRVKSWAELSEKGLP